MQIIRAGVRVARIVQLHAAEKRNAQVRVRVNGISLDGHAPHGVIVNAHAVAAVVGNDVARARARAADQVHAGGGADAAVGISQRQPAGGDPDAVAGHLVVAGVAKIGDQLHAVISVRTNHVALARREAADQIARQVADEHAVVLVRQRRRAGDIRADQISLHDVAVRQRRGRAGIRIRRFPAAAADVHAVAQIAADEIPLSAARAADEVGRAIRNVHAVKRVRNRRRAGRVHANVISENAVGRTANQPRAAAVIKCFAVARNQIALERVRAADDRARRVGHINAVVRVAQIRRARRVHADVISADEIVRRSGEPDAVIVRGNQVARRQRAAADHVVAASRDAGKIRRVAELHACALAARARHAVARHAEIAALHAAVRAVGDLDRVAGRVAVAAKTVHRQRADDAVARGDDEPVHKTARALPRDLDHRRVAVARLRRAVNRHRLRDHRQRVRRRDARAATGDAKRDDVRARSGVGIQHRLAQRTRAAVVGAGHGERRRARRETHCAR